MTKAKKFLIGYVLILLSIAFPSGCSILLFNALVDKYPHKTSFIALFILINIVFVSLLYSILDYIRRKRTVDRPTEIILDATKKITRGDFTVHIEPLHEYGKYDEFDCIIANVNDMASELKKSEVLKTDFVANVSHEIKTPLSIICNYATLLQNKSLSSEQVVEYSQNLFGASQRLSNLVSNILKLNKLDNQAIETNKENLRLDNIVCDCLIQFEDLFEKKNIALECDITENITYTADKTYIEIAINNLISNAVKFTNENGNISVFLKQDSNYIIFGVRDDGIGMDENTGAHIFDKFYQGDSSRLQEGNGLGLALVKKVIDNMGGKITVESELGKGSLFTIFLNKSDEDV